MNGEQLRNMKILRLVSGIDPDVLNSLLLIKWISTRSNEELRWSKGITCSDGEALWNMIVKEAYRTDGCVFSAIKYAIDEIKPHLSFAANLAERLCTVAVDECALKDSVRLLSNIAIDDDTLSAIFEYNWARETRAGSPSPGDFYTPKQVVQLMTELLGMKDGGTVYDPCCGSGAMLCGAALSRPGKKPLLYGQAPDQETFCISQMNLMFHGLSADFGRRPANSLLEDMHADQSFDYILANPPFNSSDWCEDNAAIWNTQYLSDLYNIFGGVFAKKDAFGRGIPMVDVKTVIHHMFLPETLSVRVDLPDGDASKYDIRRGDVLLNRTSETIDELACCSVALNDRAAVYGAYLKRLRPIKDDQVDPGYIAAYFRSKIYRQEIERVSLVYTTRANINLHQLSGIRLYYPNMTWQHEIGETLSSVIRFDQECQDTELNELIDRFIGAFIEKFITYPVLLFQKGRDE